LKRKAQYSVEFVLIFPLLILLLFGTIEFGLYYRNVYIVQDIAEEAATTASREIVNDSMFDNTMISASFNAAAASAAQVVINRSTSLSIPGLILDYNDLGTTYGNRPYALYEFNSTATRNIDGVNTPIIQLLVDYRDPSQDGVALQVVYQYRPIFGGVAIPLFNGGNVVILPQHIPISSTRIQAYSTY